MGLAQYLKDTQAELKHVSWPTQQQTIYFTTVVIIISILTAAFLGIFDALFAKALQFFVIG
jgi:preprotein translocase SecE subunit